MMYEQANMLNIFVMSCGDLLLSFVVTNPLRQPFAAATSPKVRGLFFYHIQTRFISHDNLFLPSTQKEPILSDRLLVTILNTVKYPYNGVAVITMNTLFNPCAS